jgi:hypothetical protein
LPATGVPPGLYRFLPFPKTTTSQLEQSILPRKLSGRKVVKTVIYPIKFPERKDCMESPLHGKLRKKNPWTNCLWRIPDESDSSS